MMIRSVAGLGSGPSRLLLATAQRHLRNASSGSTSTSISSMQPATANAVAVAPEPVAAWTVLTATRHRRSSSSAADRQRCACLRGASFARRSISTFPEGLEILIDPRRSSSSSNTGNSSSSSRHRTRGRDSSNSSTSIRFVDKMRMVARGGDGGKGSLSLLPVARKHKLKPDGGHGGNGGSVVLVATPNLTSLNGLQHYVSGAKGGNGTSQNCHGKAGSNTIVQVPCGVLVRSVAVEGAQPHPATAGVGSSDGDEDEDEAGVEFVLFDSEEELAEFEQQQQHDPSTASSRRRQDDRRRAALADLDRPGAYCVVAKGGRGGRGTARYAGHHGPLPEPAFLIRGAQGRPGDLVHLELELKSIGDVGLVGFPNAGKSSTLKALSRASPKVAPYPFTTLHPIIGVIEYQDGFRIRMADIPGLVDGASEGRGQGLDFLRHIERTKALLYVVDASSSSSSAAEGPVEDLKVLVKEMNSYDPSLLSRPAVIAANKVDLIRAESPDDDDLERHLSLLLEDLEAAAHDLGIQCENRVVATSAGATGQGLRGLSAMLRAVVESVEQHDGQRASIPSSGAAGEGG